MYRIAKTFEFSAAHHLPHLPADHQCARPHGHNYCVTVELQGQRLDAATGFIRDYGELNAIVKADLDGRYDHRDLNEIVDFVTTAENLAEHFFHRWRTQIPELVAVRVSETPKTWAEYRRDGY